MTRAPRLQLFWLAALLSLLAGGTAAACAPAHHAAMGRRLLQGDAATAPPPAAPAAAAAASPVSAPVDGSTIIVDEVVDQKCSMMHRALVAGDVLRPGAANLQADETACCRSCLADDRCTAWVYCPDPAGCNATAAPAAAVAGSAEAASAAPVRRDIADSPAPAPAAEDEVAGRTLYLPHRGCRLLSIPAFRLRKDSPQVVAKGLGVPYISGTPVSIVLPAIPGYHVRPGTETEAGLGYKCEGSLLMHSCLLQAPVEDLAAMCDADPMCKAFVYLPNGVDSLSEPIGVFKGGPSITSIPVSALLHNPSTALYIKDSVETTSGGPNLLPAEGSGGDSSNNVLWIVLPTVLAAALVMVGGVAFYAAVAMRRAATLRTVAAAAAPEQQQQKAAAPMRVPSGKELSVGEQQQVGAGMAPLMLHAVKPSPPNSSGGSATPSESGHSPSAASACSTGSVQCPQCGSSLSIRYRRVQQHSSGQQPPPTAGPPSG